MPACRGAWPLAVLLAAASVGPSALAAPESKSATSAIDQARAQFHRGVALETAGDWAGALSLFQQVALVKLTPQVRFHIGLCEEHLGQLAAALGDYELAAHEAEEAKVPEVGAQVASRRAELRARIPQLTITRGAGGDHASVSLDGVSLGGSSIGTKLPIDPGPHRIEAVASGYKPFRLTIEIAEKEAKKVEITLDRLPAPAATPEPTAQKGAPSPDTANTEPERANLLPFIVGGAGVVSLGASAVFFILRQNAVKKLDDECTLPPGNFCPASAQSTYDQGRTYNMIGNVTLGVGVVGVAVGTVLFFTQKRPASTAPVAGIAARSSPVSLGVAAFGPSASVGATVVGSF
jgi:PEGA domain